MAGSLEREKVLEVLEIGKTYNMPSGQVSIDPLTHHAIRDVYIADLQNRVLRLRKAFKFNLLTRNKCNLKEAPNANVHYEISLDG